MWASFTYFISFFLNIPWKWNNLVSLRPNYFIFIGYLKTGGRKGGSSKPPRTPNESATDQLSLSILKSLWKLKPLMICYNLGFWVLLLPGQWGHIIFFFFLVSQVRFSKMETFSKSKCFHIFFKNTNCILQ